MKKIVSLIFVLMLCSVCFCREIRSAFLGNLDTDDVAKFQVGTFAIATCQDIVKDRSIYDFKRVDNDNLGAYLISKECMEHVYNKFSVSNGDLYRCIYPLTDSVTVIMFLFKTHESPIAWRYYCYTITIPEEK
jgi:hypothetical protein